MVIEYKHLLAALSLGAITGFTAPAGATTLQLLTMGDSITYGSQSDSDGTANPSNRDSNLGGYRFYLDRDIEDIASLSYADFDFVGNRERGIGIAGQTPFPDNQHFGVSGARAAVDDLDENGPGTEDDEFTPSMLTGIDNVGESPTNSVDAAFDPTVNTPDAVLLQIGINRLRYRRASDLGGGDLADVTASINSRVTSAFNEFVTLLDGDDGSSRLDGNTGPRTGLVDRLTNNTLDGNPGNDNTYFADDAHLFVALIIPQAREFDSGGTIDSPEGFAMARQPSMVGEYNNLVKEELLSRMGPAGDLEGRVTFVDLFSITLAELDLTALADEFFEGDVADLRLAINPESEGGTDETDYVDWLISGFDEGLYDEGAIPLTASLADPSGDNENFNLLRDQLHPTNLGYAITAQVWANALESHYGVPEPGALSLLAVGGLLVAGRRRRRA